MRLLGTMRFSNRRGHGVNVKAAGTTTKNFFGGPVLERGDEGGREGMKAVEGVAELSRPRQRSREGKNWRLKKRNRKRKTTRKSSLGAGQQIWIVG